MDEPTAVVVTVTAGHQRPACCAWRSWRLWPGMRGIKPSTFYAWSRQLKLTRAAICGVAAEGFPVAVSSPVQIGEMPKDVVWGFRGAVCGGFCRRVDLSEFVGMS
jgi:hypothetical protein